jgi:hypothetical protein
VFGLSKQNSDAESTQTRTDTMFFAFVLLLIVSGATIPFDFARANDCPCTKFHRPQGNSLVFQSRSINSEKMLVRAFI